MIDIWKRNPAIRFFAEILLMVLAAALAILIYGIIRGWSLPLQYSNGFFFAFVALAAFASSRAVLSRPKLSANPEPVEKKEPETDDPVQRIFARRSFNFRMLMASLVCLFLSVLIAQ